MEPTKMKKQHYVPQFYLRNFGRMLHCFDKTNDNYFPTTPANVAHESDFYGVAIQETPSVEAELSKMESKFNWSVSQTIAKKDVIDLSFPEFSYLCAFLAVQYMRTKEARVRLKQTINGMLEELSKQMDVNDHKIQLTEEGERSIQLNSLANFPDYAAIITQMKFIVVRNKTAIPFLTSDNPLTVWNDIDQFPWGNLGLASRGIELHIPLCPKVALIACDPTVFAAYGNFVEEYNENRIIRENWLQVSQSTRFLFSSVNDFKLVKEILEKSKQLRDPERNRGVGIGIGSKETEDIIRSGKKKFHSSIDLWLGRDFMEEFERRGRLKPQT